MDPNADEYACILLKVIFCFHLEYILCFPKLIVMFLEIGAIFFVRYLLLPVGFQEVSGKLFTD